jgi:putative polyhydroxyalkanoate system protein
MPLFHLSVPHTLPPMEARRRVEALVDQLQKKYGGRVQRVDQRWNGDVLAFRLVRSGIVIRGSLTLKARSLQVELELPWTVALFAGKLRQQFVEKARGLLGTA